MKQKTSLAMETGKEMDFDAIAPTVKPITADPDTNQQTRKDLMSQTKTILRFAACWKTNETKRWLEGSMLAGSPNGIDQENRNHDWK